MARGPRKQKKRLFWRKDRGGYYGDFRDFKDVGGGKEALITSGDSTATTDMDVARELIAERVAVLKAAREGIEPKDDPFLSTYVQRHLELKSGNRRAGTIDRDRRSFKSLLTYFGEHVKLSQITVPKLNDYVRKRQRDGVGAQTILHELHALSNLYKRAVAEGYAKSNPVSLMSDKPVIRRSEAEWLENDEAGKLIDVCSDWLLPIVATFLYTGGRKQEVLGLLVGDVDLRNRLVHFRPNSHRELKHDHHRRTVPLWPKLEIELRLYLKDRDVGDSDLLFPSPRGGGMLTDIRGSLEAAVEKAGTGKHVTLHTLRHTYAATRIQTLDNGAPVSPYTVMRELGHQSIALIERTYGHLGSTRKRKDVVEYSTTRDLFGLPLVPEKCPRM